MRECKREVFEMVVGAVCEEMGLEREVVLGRCRRVEVVDARLMWTWTGRRSCSGEVCRRGCLHTLRPDAEKEMEDALEGDAGFLDDDLLECLCSFHRFVITKNYY